MPGLRLCLLQQEALPTTPRKRSCHLAGEVSSESGDRGCRPASTQRDTLTATPHRPRGRGARAPPRAASPPRRARKAGGCQPCRPGDGTPGEAHGRIWPPRSRRRGGNGEGTSPRTGGSAGRRKCQARSPWEQGAGRLSLQARENPPHPPREGPERAPRLPPASALRAATSPGAQTSRLHWRPRRAPALLPAPRPS